MNRASLGSRSFPGQVIDGLGRLLKYRSVQLALGGWVVANAVVLILANGHLPFDRPLLEHTSFQEQLISANVAMGEVLVLIALTVWLTHRRVVPDIVARLPTRSDVRREAGYLIAYGALALLGGIALGVALGMGPISFHLSGTLFGQHDHDLATRSATFIWAGYNLIAYAVIPFAIFQRRSSPEAMLLTSSNRRNDLLVILVVLVVESLIQIAAVSDAIFGLGFGQLMLGAPLTFGLYMLGTVLPTLIFVQALLVPRYLAITRSMPATVVLGGLSYASMHFPEAWMVFNSPGNVVLSATFLILVYFGPGMIKTILTLRTGNAWVHAWAYHAIAPHTLLDTPLITRIFGIR